LYDWFLDQLVEQNKVRPRQIEFARLNLSYTVMSKRKLLQLVQENHVNGWDDPRMPTISGMRRRGYTPESLRNFADMIGVAKRDNIIELEKLEFNIREDLNKRAERRMAVFNPLKVVITNYPENKIEELDAINNPEDESAGKRKIPFGREIYIEQDDFMEDAPKKFFRLTVGKEVRLRYAYFITCTEAIKDENGNIIELRATYDPESKGGKSPDGRKVKGTLHWVSAQRNEHAIKWFERKGFRDIFKSLTLLDFSFLYLVVGDFQVPDDHYLKNLNHEMKELTELGNLLLKEKVVFIGSKMNVDEYLKASCFFLSSH